MTKQMADYVFYDGNRYELLGDTSRQLPPLEKYVFNPVPMGTACYRGYVANYEIIDTCLCLTYLVLQDANEHYPPIGGVAAVEGGGRYEGLSERMSVDSVITIGKDKPENWALPDIRLPNDYCHVLQLTLQQGCVQTVIDISEQAAAIRDELRGIFAKRLHSPNWNPFGSDENSERVGELQDYAYALMYGEDPERVIRRKQFEAELRKKLDEYVTFFQRRYSDNSPE